MILKTELMTGILEEEIAATKAYHSLIERVENSQDKWKLTQMLDDHAESVEFWRQQRKPEKNNSTIIDSSKWKKAEEAKKIEANVFEDYSDLKKSEKHSMEIYQEILNSNTSTSAEKSYIRSIIIPAHQSHIKRLDHMCLQHQTENCV